VAEELLLKRTTEPTIRRTLQLQFGITEHQAGLLLRRAIKRMQDAVEKQRPHRRAQQIASLDRLYEQAVSTGRLSAAVQVQRLLAKIEGTEKPVQVHHTGIPVTGAVDEMDGRDTEELEFFADHGYWPEEAPPDAPGALAATPDDDFPLH